MNPLRNAFTIVKQHQKAFIILNVAFYGLVLLSMAVTALKPELKDYFQSDIDKKYSEPGLLKMAADAYASRNLLLAIAITFFVNLGVSLLMTTLPSMIIPFSGFVVTFQRAFLWGVMFVPIGPLRAMLIPHSLTLVIEGQAYILAAFAAYVHGRMFLRPWLYGLKTRVEGYKAGAVATGKLYALVALTLLIGAIYEGIEVIYFMPHFL